MAFHIRNCVGTRDDRSFAVQWLACTLPCRRFAGVLTDVCARLGADADRYSFTVRDSHPLLLVGLPAHSETLHKNGNRVVHFALVLAASGERSGWAHKSPVRRLGIRKGLIRASTVDRRPLLAPWLGFLNLRRKLKEQMLLTKAADKLHANWQP